MSIKLKLGVQRVVASFTMTATLLSLAGFAAFAPTAALAVAPSDFGLHEGDTISASGTNDPDIYIVNDWGYKRLFVNPAIFTLYGHLSWATVKSVSAATRDAFGTSGLFRNCETNDQKVYGLEVVSEDVANLHWVNTSGAQAVLDDANFFKKVFCINSREQALYGTGAAYTSVNQIPPYVRNPGQNGALSASVSSDNPVSGTLIETQAAADLAHFTFTGSGNVTNLVLNRMGVSSDTSLTNVYLYMGSKRLTDAATVSSGKITFSDLAGLFAVNGSANISVRADIANGTSGQTIGVQLSSFNGKSMVLTGNLFTIAADPSDFGTVAVGAPTPTTADSSLQAQTDYVMWNSQLTIGSHDAWLKSLQLRVIGSVLPGDLRNFRLTVDGVAVGSTISQVDATGYLVFDLGAGVELTAGTRTLKLIGDVIGGSTRTFSVSLRQKPDISVFESQYGVGILPSGTFPAAAPTSGSHTIASGTTTITKATDSASGDVVKDSTSVSLVKYKFEAFGEALKFESLRASFTGSIAGLDSLRNAGIYADGVQIGSLASLCEDSVSTTASCSAGTAYTEFSLGSSLIVTPGTPRTVEVRADIYDNTGTNNATADATIIAQLIAGSSNVQRLTSLGYFSNTAPSVGSTLTIKTGSFTVSKYTGYTNQSVVTPKTQFKIGHYNLTAATSEDVNVNTLVLDVTDAANTGAFQAADLSNVFLRVWRDDGTMALQTTPKSTVSGTASNSYSVNFTIPKTKTWQVEVVADIGSATGSAALVTNLDATGLTTSSNTSATASQATGQTITSASGSLNLNNGSSYANTLVGAGQQTAVYAFTLQPQYDDFTLDDAVFKLSGTVASSAGAVAYAVLKENGTQVGAQTSAIANSSSISLSFVGLNRPISTAGGTKTYTVEVKFSNVGPNANDTGGLVLVQLSHLKYRNSSGSITTSVVDPSTYQGSSNYLVAAYPTFANVALPTSNLSAGTQTLFKTQITSSGTGLVWRKVVFTIGTSNGPTLAESGFQLWENGQDITSLASTSVASGYKYATASRDFDTAGTTSGRLIFVFNSDRAISGTTTLELKGSVGGTLTDGLSISTQIANPNGSTFVASDDVVSLGGTAASGWKTDVDPTFLWSDSSAPSHSSTTDDWMGDGLVKGLAVSQAMD